jgi:aspartyl/asparaginyl beta-hydroxylase (cupin superfamily)
MNSNKGTLATLIKSAVLKTRVRPRPSPSIFFFPGLTQRSPVLSSDSSPALQRIAKQLRDAFPVVLQEYKSLRERTKGSSDYKEEAKDDAKLHTGSWAWNSYVLKGERQPAFAAMCPNTVELLESFRSPVLMAETPFSFAFFSTMGPGAQIAPHFGPCNLRIRCHFPLIVPRESDVGMEVGGEQVRWQAGQPVFFDDSFEHKVWNRTKQERVLLLFDLWHPDLHEEEIHAIVDMFSFAKEQGWMGSNKT